MPFTLANSDNFAAAQGAGTDVSCIICGDDRTISGSTDAYSVLFQGTLTTVTALLTPGSGHDFIVSSIAISNPGATARVVTFYLDKGGTTYTAATQWGPAITLAAGESAEWGEHGWIVYSSTGIAKVSSGQVITRAYFAPAQAVPTTRVYLTNTGITVASMVAGMILRWQLALTKTGAGAVAPILELLVGANGTTADTARFVTATTVWTQAMLAQSGAVDRALLEVELYCVGAGASGSLYGQFKLGHMLAITGFSVAGTQFQGGITGSIDISAANNIYGLVVTTGSSSAWTLDTVRTELITP